MGKGLEALGKLTGTQNLTMYEQNECLKIIEKELKNYEETNSKLDNLFESLGIESKEDLIKKLKALEIIKNKMVDVGKLFYCYETLEEYNKWVSEKDNLTQEEYDLLKEVLL